MKLINKDRLNEEWEYLIPFGITPTLVENLKWIVNKQEEIEAIPLEWIFNHYEVGNIEQNKALDDLIRIWRKESADKYLQTQFCTNCKYYPKYNLGKISEKCGFSVEEFLVFDNDGLWCGNYKKLNKKDKKQLKIAEYKLKGMKGKK